MAAKCLNNPGRLLCAGLAFVAWLCNVDGLAAELDDLFNHIDLFTYIILRLDGTLIHIHTR